MTKHVIVIGAGICGLSIALGLKGAGIPFTLLESSSRCGGRICSADGYDLGPAWFWPGQQRIVRLLQRLNLSFYTQQDDGFGLHQTNDQLQRIPSGYMPTSYRVENGLASITKAMASLIGEEHIQYAQTVTKIVQHSLEQIAVVTSHDNAPFAASHVVLALPPRLAEYAMTFEPALPPSLSEEMREMPTWMANSVKVLVRYETAFWRQSQLSGTAFSQDGPLVQIHDASQPSQDEAALFGFVGSIPDPLRNNITELKALVIEQLVRLFGDSAQHYVSIQVKDWRDDINVATPVDSRPLFDHPRYGLSKTNLWNGKLLFSGTESVVEHGGLIEGALFAAEKTLQVLVDDFDITEQ